MLRVLLTKRTYAPERVQLGGADNHRVITFDPAMIHELSKRWEVAETPNAWILERARPQISVTLAKTSLAFESIGISIEREHFETSGKTQELLDLLKELYLLMHASYGYVYVWEMVRKHNHPLGPLRLGIDLKRALPDVFWANFLGPEYVEMFGPERVYSTPCYRADRLADGGALLLLSPSPLDFLKDPQNFEKLGLELKSYLGEDAFDAGWPTRQGRVPRFRYLDGRTKETASRISVGKKDLLSSVERSRWEKWIQDSDSLALNLAVEMEKRGVKLDFTEESLARLDAYLEKLHISKSTPTLEFLMNIAAYVSRVVIQRTGATWSFMESDDIPSLMAGDIQVAPLARALKVMEEGEKFEPWYRFLVHELITAVKSAKVS